MQTIVFIFFRKYSRNRSFNMTSHISYYAIFNDSFNLDLILVSLRYFVISFGQNVEVEVYDI